MTPKTLYDSGSYFVSVTVCVQAVRLSEPVMVMLSSNSTASGDTLLGVSVSLCSAGGISHFKG